MEVQELLALRIRLLIADLTDSATNLPGLLATFDTVIGCTGFAAGSGFQRRLCEAVLEAGIKRYIPWQFGVDYDLIGRGSAQDLFNEQLDVRDFLRSQDRTKWIIISTGLFTNFLFEPSFGVVDLAQHSVNALGHWQNLVTVTTAEDIGRLTAAIVLEEPPIANEIVYTAGDTISYANLADTVDRVSNRKVRREEWSIARLKDELARDPTSALRKYRIVFAEGRGVSWDSLRTFNAKRGIQVTSVEGWLRKNLHVLARLKSSM